MVPLLQSAGRSCLRSLICIAVVISLAVAVEASETWNVAKNTYTKVRVREVTPATVTIFHSGGISQLKLADLPATLQDRFNYDPGTAAEWLRARDAEREEQVKQRIRVHAAPPGSAAMDLPAGSSQSSVRGVPVRFKEEVDLRPIYREKGLIVKSQGRRPSCSIFAVVSALEYEQARATGTAEPLSEEFLIWASRQIQPGIPLDDGYHFSEVISALQEYGIPPIELVPNTYGKRIDAIQPSAEAIAVAKERASVRAVWFRRDDPKLIERVVGALNNNTPVIVGTRWPHWKTLRDTNTLSDQIPMEDASHAVTLVGYRNTGGTPEGTTFIFRNSYGYNWGLAGCGFMTADYLTEHVVTALHLKVQ